MVARDLGTKKITNPTPRKENPEWKKDSGPEVPKYLPDEPHIGSVQSNDPKPSTRQTGIVRGGTTNPTEGQSGEVEHIELSKGDRRAH